ncbi:hypothetical protein K493DRAFT_404310 [Basidiobolus meristosporus CBS 931.73]|uniref:Uncharacterized protein n=1 Tax=Basidiobolus meristosporus CBS 931.73 TaxID=1314790 RepID=A0A1Y1Z5N4_9FUNG|nr:hypothetical protein K493DRAFT_404310 [Basidiobolus meristosporus CBS 931.73]|eukprot:ORY05526.1 hypothetical protein K493DRAFT_404310 [Basidiobolus meristosporus CBS 931.73]
MCVTAVVTQSVCAAGCDKYLEVKFELVPESGGSRRCVRARIEAYSATFKDKQCGLAASLGAAEEPFLALRLRNTLGAAVDESSTVINSKGLLEDVVRPYLETGLQSFGQEYHRTTVLYGCAADSQACDLLTKATSAFNQLSFEWKYIDKPSDGQFFLVYLPSFTQQMPHDGYLWMDDEQFLKIPLPDTREMHVAERKCGFLPGEQYVSMQRRRYRIGKVGNDQLQLLHYVKPDESMKIPANIALSKVPVRRYPLPPIFLSGMPGSQMNNSPMGTINLPHVSGNPHIPNASLHQSSPYNLQQKIPQVSQTPHQMMNTTFINQAPIRTPPRTVVKSQVARKKGVKQAPQPMANPDISEQFGDELDVLTPRDIAMARYKRNHDYLAELLSPHHISQYINSIDGHISQSLTKPIIGSILPPSIKASTQSVPELKEKLSATEEEIKALKAGYESKKQAFTSEGEVLSKAIEELKEIESIEDLETYHKKMQHQFPVEFDNQSNLKVVEIQADDEWPTDSLLEPL